MTDPEPLPNKIMSISIQCNDHWRLPLSPAQLEIAMRAMWIDLSNTSTPVLAHGLLELAIMNDNQITEINLDYLKTPGPTNVLAFPAQSLTAPSFNRSKFFIASTFSDALNSHSLLNKIDEHINHTCDDAIQDHLGWLAMSLETMSREALIYKQPIDTYIIRLLAHGMAHLVGYDHGALMDDASSSAMSRAIYELNKQGRIV